VTGQLRLPGHEHAFIYAVRKQKKQEQVSAVYSGNRARRETIPEKLKYGKGRSAGRKCSIASDISWEKWHSMMGGR